ncbi:cyclin-D3-3 [Cajanus cajan]|uniref:cyclin-D3-3 n=1 Tax=Cajanus cajan TaxID=3821 RepID=UPI00098DB78D|nr:cyclin-D3-3 [Cajanus cajan]
MANLLDTLYCSEEHWEEEEEEDDDYVGGSGNTSMSMSSSIPLMVDEEELRWLVEKEEAVKRWVGSDPELESGRREGVEWMLKVIAHYSFSPTTALLAVNYLDRFLLAFRFQNGKPWMTHLAAVACLSLAAKLEETQVPLLLDLQVEDTPYLFEAKAIKKMEIFVLSTLGWRMNPPTPLSFLHYITARLAFKDHFLTTCESLLLSLLPDSRFFSYLPSVLATATIMQVIKNVHPRLEGEYESQIIGILGIDKEEVNECRKVMLELWRGWEQKQCMKRKFGLGWAPGSPNGVMDVSFSGDSSNESWAVAASVCSWPEPLWKKSRSEEQLLLNSHFL